MTTPLRILSCQSANDFDLDHLFLVPEGWTEDEASAKAAQVHLDFQSSPDPSDWEAFGQAMVAAGFIWPKFIIGPIWDTASGHLPRREIR